MAGPDDSALPHGTEPLTAPVESGGAGLVTGPEHTKGAALTPARTNSVQKAKPAPRKVQSDPVRPLS